MIPLTASLKGPQWSDFSALIYNNMTCRAYKYKLTLVRTTLPPVRSMFAALTPLLIFVAFILLLLVSLSAPIIHNIYLFRLSASISSSFLDSGASGSVQFGVWGYCVSAIDVSYVDLISRLLSGISRLMTFLYIVWQDSVAIKLPNVQVPILDIHLTRLWLRFCKLLQVINCLFLLSVRTLDMLTTLRI